VTALGRFDSFDPRQANGRLRRFSVTQRLHLERLFLPHSRHLPPPIPIGSLVQQPVIRFARNPAQNVRKSKQYDYWHWAD